MTGVVRIDAVIVGDEPVSWTTAGFDVVDAAVVVDGTAIECRGDESSPYWRLWADGDRLPDDIDGLTTETANDLRPPLAPPHPNHVIGIDHIVLASPDLDRTTDAFADLDVACRRIRDVPGNQAAMQQRFFRLGPVIIEVVGSAAPSGDGPLSIWGFAFTVSDIDAAAEHLGPACGEPKDAVQPGRRIATVRTRMVGISLPIALMTATATAS